MSDDESPEPKEEFCRCTGDGYVIDTFPSICGSCGKRHEDSVQQFNEWLKRGWILK